MPEFQWDTFLVTSLLNGCDTHSHATGTDQFFQQIDLITKSHSLRDGAAAVCRVSRLLLDGYRMAMSVHPSCQPRLQCSTLEEVPQ